MQKGCGFEPGQRECLYFSFHSYFFQSWVRQIIFGISSGAACMDTFSS